MQGGLSVCLTAAMNAGGGGAVGVGGGWRVTYVRKWNGRTARRVLASAEAD